MLIATIIQQLEALASPTLQESYDNAGLLVGSKKWTCTGIICTLDVTEKVVQEAVAKKCNLIVAHHPLIFGGLKKINGNNYVEQTVIAAIKNDIAIYAIHTNLDNITTGVNARIAAKIGLTNCSVLVPKPKQLQKLYTYIPTNAVEKVKQALFAIGAGTIGHYSQCSFSVVGTGTFTPGKLATPTIGKKLQPTTIEEHKVELLFPSWLQQKVIQTLKEAHPYEEVAYEIISLENSHQEVGSGLIGYLPKPITERELLKNLKSTFKLTCIRHSVFLQKKVKKIALCGGSGSFLTKNSIAVGADAYITADIKYHEFFDANNQLLLIDIGHWESEQFTIDLIFEHLRQKNPNFAIQKTKIKTNSVNYYV